MASVWIRTRAAKSGVRHRVEYRPGGRDTATRFAGSFRTKRLATLRAAFVEGELAAGRVPVVFPRAKRPLTPTVDKALDRWLESRIDVNEATKVRNSSEAKRIRPLLGRQRTDEIRPTDVSAFVVAMSAKGYKRGTIRKTLQTLAMTLDHEGVTPNPARDRSVKLPREETEEINPPTAAHVETVYRLIPSRHRLPLLWLDWSGARVSSIDLTRVGDYDEPRRRVRLRAATTKTRKALWVELPPVLAAALETHLGPREDRNPGAPLFDGSGADALRTSIAKACKASGIPTWSPHDLRHRRISLLHLRGMPWARIGEFVGQRSLSVTADVYTHVLGDETEVDYAVLLG